MTTGHFIERLQTGLWRENPGLVQLLGLCPLLAVTSTFVNGLGLIFKAWFPALDRSLGIFIPLIVTNCAIVARAELFASRNGIVASLFDGIGMGTGFALLLIGIGFFRELIGRGSVFSDLDMLFGGEPLPGLLLVDGGWLIAVLPPGAFFSLALAIALKNYLDAKSTAARKT